MTNLTVINITRKMMTMKTMTKNQNQRRACFKFMTTQTNKLKLMLNERMNKLSNKIN